MKKIVAVSNSPIAPTGYGTQIRQLGMRARKAGWDFSVSANYGAPVNMEVDGIPVWSEGLIKYANDSGPENIALAANEGGFGMTLMDVWVGMNPMWHTLPLVCWVPIDHDPAPPQVARWCIEGGNKYIVAMSKHGEQALLKAGVPRDRLTYIPHAIDMSVWTPDGPTMREQLRVPQASHLTIITAMNKGERKSFPEMLMGWSLFQKIVQDAYLYLHTDRYGHLEGLPLMPILAALGVDPNVIRWVNPIQMRAGVDTATLAALTRSANCSLLTSRGEGFGLPVLEAQAVGTPVVVSDFSAQTELCKEYGSLVGGQLGWDRVQESWYKIPNVLQIRDALLRNHERWQGKLVDGKMEHQVDRHLLASQVQEYDADLVYAEKWQPLFEKIASGEIKLGADAQKPVPVNRAARRAKRRGGR